MILKYLLPFSAKSFNSSIISPFGPVDAIFVRSFNEFIYILPINTGNTSSKRKKHIVLLFIVSFIYYYFLFYMTIVFQVHLTLYKIFSDHQVIHRYFSMNNKILFSSTSTELFYLFPTSKCI